VLRRWCSLIPAIALHGLSPIVQPVDQREFAARLVRSDPWWIRPGHHQARSGAARDLDRPAARLAP